MNLTHFAALEAAVSTTAAAPASCTPDETKTAAAAKYTGDFMFRTDVTLETEMEDKLAFIY